MKKLVALLMVVLVSAVCAQPISKIQVITELGLESQFDAGAGTQTATGTQRGVCLYGRSHHAVLQLYIQ